LHYYTKVDALLYCDHLVKKGLADSTITVRKKSDFYSIVCHRHRWFHEFEIRSTINQTINGLRFHRKKQPQFGEKVKK